MLFFKHLGFKLSRKKVGFGWGAPAVTLVLWYMDFVSAQLTQSRLLQASTERRKYILSYVYLGKEVIDGARYCPDAPLLIYVYSQLSKLYSLKTYDEIRGDPTAPKPILARAILLIVLALHK